MRVSMKGSGNIETVWHIKESPLESRREDKSGGD